MLVVANACWALSVNARILVVSQIFYTRKIRFFSYGLCVIAAAEKHNSTTEFVTLTRIKHIERKNFTAFCHTFLNEITEWWWWEWVTDMSYVSRSRRSTYRENLIHMYNVYVYSHSYIITSCIVVHNVSSIEEASGREKARFVCAYGEMTWAIVVSNKIYPHACQPSWATSFIDTIYWKYIEVIYSLRILCEA